MPRLPRYAAPGYPQHVIQRGNNRSVIFVTEDDYIFFVQCLASAIERHPCLIHAYVLMSNHVHFLMTPGDQGAIGRVMQSVGRRYVQYFNAKYGRTGTLWEGRYRATLVDSEGYLITCYCYIELNPVRAGMVAHPGAYRWSSHAANANGVRDSLVTPHELYAALGSDDATRQAAYRDLFQVEIDDATLRTIRTATNTGWLLGSSQFREEVAPSLNRRPSRLVRGGPRR